MRWKVNDYRPSFTVSEPPQKRSVLGSAWLNGLSLYANSVRVVDREFLDW